MSRLIENPGNRSEMPREKDTISRFIDIFVRNETERRKKKEISFAAFADLKLDSNTNSYWKEDKKRKHIKL